MTKQAKLTKAEKAAIETQKAEAAAQAAADALKAKQNTAGRAVELVGLYCDATDKRMESCALFKFELVDPIKVQDDSNPEWVTLRGATVQALLERFTSKARTTGDVTICDTDESRAKVRSLYAQESSRGMSETDKAIRDAVRMAINRDWANLKNGAQVRAKAKPASTPAPSKAEASVASVTPVEAKPDAAPLEAMLRGEGLTGLQVGVLVHNWLAIHVDMTTRRELLLDLFDTLKLYSEKQGGAISARPALRGFAESEAEAKAA